MKYLAKDITITLTSSSINTQNRSKKLRMDLSWHALNSTLKAKTLYQTEKQGFHYLWLSKNFRHTHQNSLKPTPVSEKSAYSMQNYIMLFSTHLWVREFWPQIYSL